MDLVGWQARLQSHFEELRRRRSRERPIFGLEHGLSSLEIDDLKNQLLASITQAPPTGQNPLPWIVYASEFGYQYSGAEYWQTFERYTPGWQKYGDRYWIQQCFRDFQLQYLGAKPSGRWADHFSIICWPITHAILPRDLQRQLANTLYDLRDSFRAEFFESPALLGEQIRAHSWRATSRFQNFAEEPLLVGQIAAALLLQKEDLAEKLILRDTLRRIATDLDRERRARDWLLDAQRSAQRVRLRGLQSARTPPGAIGPLRERLQEQVASLAIEPRIVLRPAAISSWDVLIEIPDLSPLLVRFPKLHHLLVESRCFVTGSATRSPLARGRLLHGTQYVLLREWPKSDSILLRFEQSTSELDALLSTECLLRPGPSWLFRVGSDGFAYEVRSKVARPGQSYVLLDNRGPINIGFGMTTALTCSDIFALRLDLPNAIQAQWQDALKDLGLNQARSVHVWPAGLPTANWDEEGRGEWLSTEQPQLGIRVDHPVEHVSLTLSGDEMRNLDVIPSGPGVPVFVELPLLPLGVHTLNVSTLATGVEFEPQTGQLELVIREPRKWVPGLDYQGPLLIVVDPPAPNLEQLWESRVSIEIHGPTDRQIACSVALFDKRSDSPLFFKRLPPLQLPTDSLSWRRYFERNYQSDETVQNMYDLAQTCEVRFDAEELGTFSLRCEREFAPIRWVVQSVGRRYTLILADDTGSGSTPEVNHFEFRTPDAPAPLDGTLFVHGFSISEAGGLYVARTGQYECAAILPPQVRTLADMRVEPHLGPRINLPAGADQAMNYIELWSGARVTGNIVALTQRNVVLRALLRGLFGAICGGRWERVERELLAANDDSTLNLLAQAISINQSERRLADALMASYKDFSRVAVRERIHRMSSLAQKFLPLPDGRGLIARITRDGNVTHFERSETADNAVWLTEFALRLASCPETVRSWSGSNFRGGIEQLMRVRTLAKATRFLVLATDKYLQAQVSEGWRLYSGWEWQ